MSNTNILARAKNALAEIKKHLEQGIIPFWTKNGIDHECGGYLTCFDENGVLGADTDKYIVTQTRMIWGFSALAEIYPDNAQFKQAANDGVAFFIKHFWDKEHGGWRWKTKRDGALLDAGKVVYGQSFAIYALAQHYLATKDEHSLRLAENTFDLLQKYALDSLRGGYYENLEPDWTLSAPGFAAGDRKSLDIHMHLMEAFTVLYKASGKEIHKRRLAEVIQTILTKTVNLNDGCGLNQFDLDFNPIPAINIRRTWNAERATGEEIPVPTDTTSYGHNVELAWLLNRACDVMGDPADTYNAITKKLVDHSLKYGYDYKHGGVYRDGPHAGAALVTDKEWWQNSEVLVGYLDAYTHHTDERYLEAFLGTWAFASKHMINHALGEWRQLLNRAGAPIVSDIGNPWKAFYHSGRSMMECVSRLGKILESGE